ncbi:MAG: ABC transporter ATP-binding protein [Spirochaetaceae bacterium]|jgi:peptide/nickel transport system ATP-binding protein|nr:ABC transporter ATP-binding protein [Spirochaetaceae bacterium]
MEKPGAAPLLEVRRLKKYFDTPQGKLHAVDELSFSIPRGETLGIVGESGCGKTTVGRTIMLLHQPTGGEIIFDGENITGYSKKQIKPLRRRMQIIFQDPFSSLNPRMTVFEAIAHPLLLNGLYKNNNAAEERVLRLMEMVGLSRRLINTYPHELDGGRRQRIVIARALSLEPEFIVCDEPVSALDVSVQAQILNLLQDRQEDMGLTYMFITHNLAVVKHLSNHIVVMYLGQIVEMASSRELFARPLHPYTRALISAIPVANIHVEQRRILLRGEISSPINPRKGCRFAKRCAFAEPGCAESDPAMETAEPGHQVACFRWRELTGYPADQSAGKAPKEAANADN